MLGQSIHDNYEKVLKSETKTAEFSPTRIFPEVEKPKLKLYSKIRRIMLLTPHTLIGVAVGASIPNPFIAVPLSFMLHFLADKVPHWDFYSATQKEQRLKGWRPIAVMADLVIAVGIGLSFTLYALWVNGNPAMAINIFLCGIASVLPDALEGPYIFMDKEPDFLKPLTKIQKKMQFQAPLPWGLFTQLIVVLVCLAIVSTQLGLK